MDHDQILIEAAEYRGYTYDHTNKEYIPSLEPDDKHLKLDEPIFDSHDLDTPIIVFLILYSLSLTSYLQLMLTDTRVKERIILKED